MHNQNFDIAFKNKLESYSPTPSSNVWNAIQSEISISTISSQSINLKATTIAVSSLVVASLILYSFCKTDKTTTITPNKKTEITSIKSIPSEQTVVSEKLEISETQIINNSIITSSVKRTTLPLLEKETKETLEIELVNENTTTNNITAEVTTDKSPNEIQEVGVIEKVYTEGEHITFRFDFQNTTGQNLNSVEIWEEFPEWCDVNSIQTVSSDNFHTVKTKIHERYHEVVWKIKGDFSGDPSSVNNKGFIEYKVKLTQDRKASELNKNKPQIK